MACFDPSSAGTERQSLQSSLLERLNRWPLAFSNEHRFGDLNLLVWASFHLDCKMFVVQIEGDDLGSKRSPLGLAHASHPANLYAGIRLTERSYSIKLFGIIKGTLVRGKNGLGA
jgi:hypothetical protein